MNESKRAFGRAKKLLKSMNTEDKRALLAEIQANLATKSSFDGLDQSEVDSILRSFEAPGAELRHAMRKSMSSKRQFTHGEVLVDLSHWKRNELIDLLACANDELHHRGINLLNPDKSRWAVYTEQDIDDVVKQRDKMWRDGWSAQAEIFLHSGRLGEYLEYIAGVAGDRGDMLRLKLGFSLAPDALEKLREISPDSVAYYGSRENLIKSLFGQYGLLKHTVQKQDEELAAILGEQEAQSGVTLSSTLTDLRERVFAYLQVLRAIDQRKDNGDGLLAVLAKYGGSHYAAIASLAPHFIPKKKTAAEDLQMREYAVNQILTIEQKYQNRETAITAYLNEVGDKADLSLIEMALKRRMEESKDPIGMVQQWITRSIKKRQIRLSLDSTDTLLSLE